MTSIKYELTIEQVNTILHALYARPFAEVEALVTHLRGTALAQLNPAPAPAAEQQPATEE